MLLNEEILDTLNNLPDNITNLLSSESVTTSFVYSKEQDEVLIRIIIKNVNLPFKSFEIDDIKKI